jgi:hypothetical protein
MCSVTLCAACGVMMYSLQLAHTLELSVINDLMSRTSRLKIIKIYPAVSGTHFGVILWVVMIIIVVIFSYENHRPE